MATERVVPAEILGLRRRFDGVLGAFLQERRRELKEIHAGAVTPLDEIERLILSGGKRLRPMFCYWGFRAAGGSDGEPILKVAASMELLHSMALMHDDVMDGAKERRGLPTVEAAQAEAANRRGADDPARVGRSVAILAGDLAAVLADVLMLESGFAPERLAHALARYDRMRLEMAAGQYLDVVGVSVDVRRLAALKGGSYTVEGPLLIGAELADAPSGVAGSLVRYGGPLGQAFQLRDDLLDGDAVAGVGEADVARLVAEAREGLDPSVITSDAMDALETLADLVASG